MAMKTHDRTSRWRILHTLILHTLILNVLIGSPISLNAQTPSDEEEVQHEEELQHDARSNDEGLTPHEGLIPPKPLTSTEIPYPDSPPKHTSPVEVKVKLTLDEEGRVSEVTLTSPPQPIFDEAVLRGARDFRFSPALFNGQPIKVEVDFSQIFLPPERPEQVEEGKIEEGKVEEGPAVDAVLSGQLKEKGTREWIEGASIIVKVNGHTFFTTSGRRGEFKLRVPHGQVQVIVASSAHLKFKQRERLKIDEEVSVIYLVQRKNYNPDEITVIGKRRRVEISRTTLKGKEIRQVAGTFGDPFRVVQTLPGVTTPVSLLPFPIVRGSSPSSTGFLLDRVRVPLLFHLLGGPSVIHPMFIEEIHFYPGGFPVYYGGYTGGIVDGETRRSAPDERLVDIDLNFLQTGAMVRTPVPGTNMQMSAAGRYGYPGLLISLLSEDFDLSYWDYQFRLDGGTPRNGWTIFSFGARDIISTRPEERGELEPSLQYEFHRLDLRYRYGAGALSLKGQLALGVDNTLFGSDEEAIGLWHLTPRVDGEYKVNDVLDLQVGVDASHRARDLTLQGASQGASQGAPSEGQGSSEDDSIDQPGDITTAGVYGAVLWQLTDQLLIVPGVRMDWWRDQTAHQLTVDPRLTARYRLTHQRAPKSSGKERTAQHDTAHTEKDEPDSIWLKASLGQYHQPPRFLIPIPGLDQLAIEYGMLSSVQTSLGVELPFGKGISLDTQVYYSDMDPVIFDLNINAESVLVTPTFAPGTAPEEEEEEGEEGRSEGLDRFLQPQVGRAYGLELLLRKRSSHGVYGWLSYTLSRSERRREGEWVPFDFDRPHILNAVIGVPLGNQWEVGTRFQYQSGAPTTTTYGYNTGRKDDYIRLDIRIDKRAVWKEWMLDYYIDIQNILLSPEEVAPGTLFRFVLPTIGLRAKL